MDPKNRFSRRGGKAFQVIVLVVIPLLALGIVSYFYFSDRAVEAPPDESPPGISLPELWTGATKRVDNARAVYREGLRLKRDDQKEEARVKVEKAMSLFDASIGDAEGILEENARVLQERDGYSPEQARAANKNRWEDVSRWQMEANDCRSVLKSLEASKPEAPAESGGTGTSGGGGG